MQKLADILYRRPFLLFLLFLLAAYLPVLLPFFHLKNDILTQNLPTRFVFGESLYSGYEPFWNPYLHFGTPQYGDMNNGFWNPVQWLIAFAGSYTLFSITMEEMFYILIGGWGIYKVSKEIFSKQAALITGLAYMCCGYVTGHMQYLCWITGVGYFPYVLLFFLRINKNPVLKNFLAGGISVFLFVASTHPGLIIGAAYFFAFAIIIIYLNRKEFLRFLYHPGFWKINSLFFLTSCALSVVVIVSNLEVLRHISRAGRVSAEQALWAPTTLQSYLSVYLPLAVHKSGFFNTDIAMRNVYFGLLHLAGIFYSIRYLTRKKLLSILIPLLFFILLSAGGYFKIFAWKVLPLIGHVRLNGEFAYFVILLLLLWGAAGIQNFIDDKKNSGSARLLYHLFLVSVIIAALAAAIILFTSSSVFFARSLNTGSLKDAIKAAIDNTSFWDLLLLQAVIQAITFYFLHRYKNKKTQAAFFACLNCIIITWLTLPFTGLGMMSRKEVQSVINVFPRGIQPQGLIPINEAEYIKPKDENQFLLIASYSKKIGHIKPDQYPVQLNSNITFAEDAALYSFIKNQAFIFLSDDTTMDATTSFDSAAIRIIKSGPGYTKSIITNDRFGWLTLLQNNYPHWSVKLNGKQVNHYTGFKTFISVPVEKGVYEVEFIFNTSRIKTVMWINIAALVISLIFIYRPASARFSVFK